MPIRAPTTFGGTARAGSSSPSRRRSRRVLWPCEAGRTYGFQQTRRATPQGRARRVFCWFLRNRRLSFESGEESARAGSALFDIVNRVPRLDAAAGRHHFLWGALSPGLQRSAPETWVLRRRVEAKRIASSWLRGRNRPPMRSGALGDAMNPIATSPGPRRRVSNPRPVRRGAPVRCSDGAARPPRAGRWAEDFEVSGPSCGSAGDLRTVAVLDFDYPRVHQICGRSSAARAARCHRAEAGSTPAVRSRFRTPHRRRMQIDFAPWLGRTEGAVRDGRSGSSDFRGAMRSTREQQCPGGSPGSYPGACEVRLLGPLPKIRCSLGVVGQHAALKTRRTPFDAVRLRQFRRGGKLNALEARWTNGSWVQRHTAPV